ncbi:MAG: hypothetical protein DRN71_03915 [Candidatus Nanohalarchaeota archaeon]|nr:MAG: hypothetical protein DRN71_03915 [Candidatus Nanohaloarchaeota archaeon]
MQIAVLASIARAAQYAVLITVIDILLTAIAIAGIRLSIGSRSQDARHSVSILRMILLSILQLTATIAARKKYLKIQLHQVILPRVLNGSVNVMSAHKRGQCMNVMTGSGDVRILQAVQHVMSRGIAIPQTVWASQAPWLLIVLVALATMVFL